MMGRSRLGSLIQRFSETRVLCVGDVMLDRYVRGEVERISPEAPIPVLRVERDSSTLGGAGNVVRNLVALGCGASLVSVVGDDPAGREVRSALKALGVEPAPVVAPRRRTSVKVRFLAKNQQMLRADRETTGPMEKRAQRRILEAASAGIARSDCRVVVISDYGKGVVDAALASRVISTARDAGKLVIVDPKDDDYERYRGASLVTPNLNELARATRMPVGDDAEIVEAARALVESHGIGGVLATRGRDGMSLIEAEGGVAHLPARARDVFDVSGAGDTVVAATAAALAVGADFSEAIVLANLAAGIAVEKVGTAAVYASELAAAADANEQSLPETRAWALEPALDRIDVWRRKGLKIGFTNGCFDLLHPGHASLLSRARETCDRLVVGLNSDASVRRQKGPTRPVQTEAERAIVLSSLAAVDMVVIFGEDTPLRLIQAIRPDVLIKGSDNRPSEVVGAREVRSYGGRLLLLDLEPHHSTTATLARVSGAMQPIGSPQ